MPLLPLLHPATPSPATQTNVVGICGPSWTVDAHPPFTRDRWLNSGSRHLCVGRCLPACLFTCLPLPRPTFPLFPYHLHLLPCCWLPLPSSPTHLLPHHLYLPHLSAFGCMWFLTLPTATPTAHTPPYPATDSTPRTTTHMTHLLPPTTATVSTTRLPLPAATPHFCPFWVRWRTVGCFGIPVARMRIP